MIKSRRMRWAGHVALMGGRRGMHIGYWWESQKERTTRKIKTLVGGVVWSGSIWLRIRISGGLL
jgi:hypothetical protein